MQSQKPGTDARRRTSVRLVNGDVIQRRVRYRDCVDGVWWGRMTLHVDGQLKSLRVRFNPSTQQWERPVTTTTVEIRRPDGTTVIDRVFRNRY